VDSKKKPKNYFSHRRDAHFPTTTFLANQGTLEELHAPQHAFMASVLAATDSPGAGDSGSIVQPIGLVRHHSTFTPLVKLAERWRPACSLLNADRQWVRRTRDCERKHHLYPPSYLLQWLVTVTGANMRFSLFPLIIVPPLLNRSRNKVAQIAWCNSFGKVCLMYHKELFRTVLVDLVRCVVDISCKILSLTLSILQCVYQRNTKVR
jgi:hypothetical protein